ncbi:acyltransferase [Salinimicrobium gaetbulicola]|uniref:Acyltransferase n=1 Tax=Salinimicrobium gaetbulicola TaxID=999702 RepID=A0ABW3IE89_9FLAO
MSQIKSTGENFICDSGVSVYGGENINIGKGVVINKGVILQSCEGAKICIKDNVTISYNAMIITGNLNFRKNEKERHFTENIEIGNQVWIGANVIVLPGVKVPDNVVLAAGSIVANSLPESNCIYGGVPAKKLKKI